MSVNIVLNNPGNAENDNSLLTNLSNNNSAITTAFGSALNNTGDKMSGTLDMNSNSIINLPSPIGLNSPLRLQDTYNPNFINTSLILTGSNIYTGNNTFSGSTIFDAVKFTGSVSVSSVNFAGVNTFTGTTNINGVSNISGTVNVTGTVQFTGNNGYTQTNTYDGSTIFQGPVVLNNTAAITVPGPIYFKDGPWYDVKAFGATGTYGTTNTDDTTAIQAAITAASLNSNGLSNVGATVFFPAGSYLISSTLTVPQGVVLRGAGRDCSCIVTSSLTADVINVTGNFVEIDSLTVQGEGTVSPPTAGYGINMNSNAVGCKFTNLYIGQVYNGIKLNGSNCLLQFVIIQYVYGPYCVNDLAGGCYICNNQFDTSAGVAYNYSSGYSPWSTHTAYASGAVVSNASSFFSCITSGTSASSGSGPQVVVYNTNTTDGTCVWQFLVNSTHTKVSLSSNSNFVYANDITGPALNGVLIANGQQNSIRDNTIDAVIGSGVACTGANVDFTIITENRISNCYGNASTGYYGVNFVNSATGSLNNIINNIFNGAGGSAIKIGGVYFNVSKNNLSGYGQTATSYGIDISASSSYFSIDGNIISNTSTGTIKVETGGSDYFVITNNIVGGSAPVNGASGSHTTITGNN